MSLTQADSALALGMPPDDVETVADLTPYYVLATDLEIGDHIRDRGAMHAIETLQRVDHPLGSSLDIFMDDDGRLSVPLHQHVTVWREVPRD